ncbi:MAG: hypothetical protein IKS20_06245 [Victivallales bacterium]|nr:hypothetical protein [Victivallales bacterium]
MAFELVYTSSQTGVKQGSTGFCTVACTRGIDPRLMLTLEGLSGYKPIYPHYDAKAMRNPVSCSHYIFGGGAAIYRHILSRACFNGVDYTGRSNKLVSHLALSQLEAKKAAGGPASLFLCEGLFKEADWQIKTEIFPMQKEIPSTNAAASKCLAWEKACGDSGWAGVIVEKFLSRKGVVYLVFAPESGMDMLALMNEAIALLPEEDRWRLTFSTYFTSLPAGMECAWRACVPDSEALVAARRSPLNLIIDLTRPLPPAEGGEYVRLARGEIASISPIQAQDRQDAPKTTGFAGKIVPHEEVSLASKDMPAPRRPSPEYNSGKPGLHGGMILVFGLCILLLLSLVFALAWWQFHGAGRMAEADEDVEIVEQDEKLPKTTGATGNSVAGKADNEAHFPAPEKESQANSEPSTKTQAEQAPLASQRVEAAFLWELYPKVQLVTAENALDVELPDELVAEKTELFLRRNGKMTRLAVVVDGNALTAVLVDMNNRPMELRLTLEGKCLKIALNRYRMPANTCICLHDLRSDKYYPLYFEPGISRLRNNEFKATCKVQNYDSASKKACFKVEFDNPFGGGEFCNGIKVLAQFGQTMEYLDCHLDDNGKFVSSFDHSTLEVQKADLSRCNSSLNKNSNSMNAKNTELQKLTSAVQGIDRKIAGLKKKKEHEGRQASQKHARNKDSNNRKTDNVQEQIAELEKRKKDFKDKINKVNSGLSELEKDKQKLLAEKDALLKQKREMLNVDPPEGQVFLLHEGQPFFLGTLKYQK